MVDVAETHDNASVPSANVDVVRRLNSAFNAGDWDAFASLVSPDVEFVDHLPLPDVQQSTRGADEMLSVLEHWREGFAAFQADILEYVDLGEYVVCATRWRFSSRDQAIELTWIGAEAHQLRAGKLVWSAAGFPDATAARQAIVQRSATGASPPADPPG